MGCSFFQDPLVKSILNTLELRSKKIIEDCVTEKAKLEAKKAIILTERHTEFKSLFDEKKEITEKKIKEYNKKEFNADKELILNEVKKVKDLYGVGKLLADDFKRGLIKKFTDQLTGAPKLAKDALKKKIDDLTKFTPVQFLHSDFGKPLLKALENYGVSAPALEKYVKELNEELEKRREKERNEFNISKNIFTEDISEKDYEKLIEAICKEISDKGE